MSPDDKKQSDHIAFDHEGWKTHIAGDISRLEQEVSRAGARTPDEFMTGVKEVISRDESLAGLFKNTVWGQIVWRKAVGRPRSQRMADAFIIEHHYEFLEWVIGPDGNPQSIGGIVKGATPRVWDGPHDDERYRVSYILQGVHPWRNGIGVKLNPEVAWEPAGPPWMALQRRLLYPESLQPWGVFYVNATGITDLDAIEVVRLFH
jgi:hypothetical protein